MRSETVDAILAKMSDDAEARMDLELELREAERLAKFWTDKAEELRLKLAEFDAD